MDTGRDKKINPSWRYEKDKAAFLKAVEKDNEFFKRLEEFSRNQREVYKDYFIPAGIKDTDKIRRIYENMDGAHQVNSFKASAAFRAQKLLPKAGGALAVLALIAPLQVAVAGHTPEQQQAFDKFYNRYQGLYRGALAGQHPDKLQLGLLKDEWIAYMQAIGIDNATVGIVNAQLEKAIADK